MLHMLSCLAIDGRFGLTAIGRTPEQAANLYERTGDAVHQREEGWARSTLLNWGGKPRHRAGRHPGDVRVHLDTDLGGDTDDACALVMLLGWAGVGSPASRRSPIPAGVARRTWRTCCTSQVATTSSGGRSGSLVHDSRPA